MNAERIPFHNSMSPPFACLPVPPTMPHQQAAIPSGGCAVAVAVADRGGCGGGASLFRNFVHGSHAGRPPSLAAWHGRLMCVRLAGCDDVGSGGKEGKERGRCDWRDGKSSLVGGPWTVIHRRPRTRDGVNWNCRLQKPARVSNIDLELVSGMELGDESLQNWKWKKGMIESWFSRGRK